MRTSLRRFVASIFVPAVCSVCATSPAWAAGTYTQDFSGGAPQWVYFDDNANTAETFEVQAGYYTNTQGGTSGAPFRSVAYYGGNTWAGNYTYTVSLYGVLKGEFHRIGVVFNLESSSRYYEVDIRVKEMNGTQVVFGGAAYLNKVINGTRTTVATYTAPANVSWPVDDVSFPVEVVRSGNTTTVRVNGVPALSSTSLTELGAGRIGAYAQFNTVRIDNVNVHDNNATLHFRTGFESGVTVTNPQCIGVDPNWTYFEDLLGADSTGFHWNNSFTSMWGLAKAPMFNTAVPCNLAYASYINIDIQSEPGPTNTQSRVLLNTVNNWRNPDTVEPRAGANYVTDGPAEPYHYIRRYLRYPDNWLQTVNSGAWFVQHEYKTSCSATVPGRFVIYWRQDVVNGQKVPYYQLAIDGNINNCNPRPLWKKDCAPGPATSLNPACPLVMPLGSWFYDELWVSNPTDGVGSFVKYAVNGVTIFNEALPSNNAMPSLPNRLKITPGYLNANGMEIQVDDLEIWTGPPCGTFPCGPPTHVN